MLGDAGSAGTSLTGVAALLEWIASRLAATLAYTYEPYRIYDFAFDPSVIDSIVQPSTLVLGYTYRPYTVHSVLFGILYRW